MRRLALTASCVAFAAAAFMHSPALAQAGKPRAELVPMAGMLFLDELVTGPVGSRLGHAGGAMYGVQLAVPLAGPVSIYASGVYSRSELNASFPFIGGFHIADTDAILVDGGLQLRVPTQGRLEPVFQLGAGVMRHSIETPIAETTATNAAVTLGAGFDVRLVPGLGLRVMARDYIGRFDFEEATLIDIQGRTGHSLGLTAGLRFSF